MFFKADAVLTEKFNKTGIKDSEKIAILSNNSERYIKLLIHIFNAGAIAVPVNPLFPPQKISNILNKINCSKIIIDGQSFSNDVPGFKIIPLDYFMDDLNLIELKKLISLFDINKFNKYADKPSSIIFTSGSTGSIKAVLHTFGNHYFNALGSNSNIELEGRDCWLISLPLNHVSGFSTIFKVLISKAYIAVKPPDLSLMEVIEKQKVTHLSIVPSQLHALINNPAGARALRRMKAILIGGAAVPGELIEESIKLMLQIYKSYGSTEMASQITCTVKDDSLEHLKRTSGKLLRYREIKTEEDGEILVKGCTLFKGYVEKDNKGNEILNMPFDEKGWFKTGDRGFIDDDGYLAVYGRKDSMFIYKGENIFPEEIENAIMELGGVENVLVVPVFKDAEGQGQIPAAFIKSKNYFQTDFELIRNSLQKKIEHFKIPVIFLKWPENEINASLKPDRKKFKKIAEKEINSR
ncbi:MAG: o-succinylbenzoate--CoA ligase [Actinobacteria bacterium]|nr:o-succinylbenzoate--CoA ligase [Actinomycetota bacterium]